MANPTYIMKRSGIYYARIPVPKQLQAELGRKELWKSLGNRSYMAQAKQKTELLRRKGAMVAIGI